MRVLGNVRAGIVVSGIWLVAVWAANAQNSQQSNGGNTGTAPSPQPNVPYTPPSAPSGGYGDAATGSYSGKGSAGYGGSGLGPQTASPGSVGRNAAGMGNEAPENQQQLEMQQARARNAERQKQLVADTQKLVALANELQDEVSKSSKDMLSLDVVRKADEIDKLARNVRDRMKNAN